ncbi:baseplate J/gp47 family protein [Anaerostipes sp.]|uniref:baseplate J/gp47 family protein n=1 Tax=Anaerostipes sp. TaxID=1872530 RepID=UPI0025C0A9F0|nr:baseplate J/gp47 family protein [Anaerostipes sp.]MBS7007055.1 baseplate J/gp47 family protein [Anaerostipes sp.]
MDEEILDNLEEELEEDDFQVPKFLEESSEEEIHKRMLDNLQKDLDTSEGGFVYDLTKPTAIEVSRMKEFELVEALKLIWPRFAEGIYLDYHAETRGLERKEAINAKGMLHIEGQAGTLIPEGTVFTTEGINDEPEKEYETMMEAQIEEDGFVDIEIQSIEAGLAGNSAENTVILQADIIEGINTVTNPAPIAGGLEAEEDESLRERIMEYDQTQGDSFVGNMNDYKRWALSVEGTGNARIVSPEDGSGVVTIYLTSSDGKPASNELCLEVKNYIMRPDNPDERLAPINSIVAVEPAAELSIAVKAVVQLKDSTIENVRNMFIKGMQEYLTTAEADGEIRYTKIANILGNTSGVYDFSNLIVNGQQGNIPIDGGKIPVLDLQNLELTE